MSRKRWTIVTLSEDGEHLRYVGGRGIMEWTHDRAEADSLRTALGADAEVVDADWLVGHTKDWVEQAKARRAAREASHGR